MNKLRIDIVSDVMCPWCIVGYKGLTIALEKLSNTLQAEINWLPFELNPDMPNEGQNIRAHLMEKYAISAQQSDQNRDMLIQRGKEVGFEFNFSEQMKMFNSFDLHRLLAWAKDQGKQHELQMALFSAHFTDNLALNEQSNLLMLIQSIGLDPQDAKKILDSESYSGQVRAEQAVNFKQQISSVPTFIINQQYVISGGQTAAVFEQALGEIIAKLAPV